MQSYHINAIGMLMNSPINNSDEYNLNKDVFDSISCNTSIPKTSARRLMLKAIKQRHKLSKEKR